MPAVDRRLLEQKLPPLELWRRYFEDYFPAAAPLPLGIFNLLLFVGYSYGGATSRRSRGDSQREAVFLLL